MMTNPHLEFLVEEPSMEAFLSVLLPRLFSDCTFRVHAFQGKTDMLGKLQARLKGYAHWPSNYGHIVVVVDCDDDNCHRLKQQAALGRRLNASCRTVATSKTGCAR